MLDNVTCVIAGGTLAMRTLSVTSVYETDASDRECEADTSDCWYGKSMAEDRSDVEMSVKSNVSSGRQL